MKQGYICNSALYIKQRPSSLVENPILRPRSPLCLSLRLRPLSVFLSEIPFHGAATFIFLCLITLQNHFFREKRESFVCLCVCFAQNFRKELSFGNGSENYNGYLMFLEANAFSCCNFVMLGKEEFWVEFSSLCNGS